MYSFVFKSKEYIQYTLANMEYTLANMEPHTTPPPHVTKPMPNAPQKKKKSIDDIINTDHNIETMACCTWCSRQLIVRVGFLMSRAVVPRYLIIDS